MRDTIILEDQGLRDGLQTLPITIDVPTKIKWVNMLLHAGLTRLQVASFVHPKLVPQMADAEQIISQLPVNENVVYSGLALNVKGVQRAIDAGLKHVAISISASNMHSLKNANKTIDQAKEEFKQMVALALENELIVRGGIQCAFGCRFEGKIDEKLILNLVESHLQTGIQEIALADSTGMGNPFQVKRLMQEVLKLTHAIPVALHFHNTENKGYANVVAAVEVGITQFDTAFGGLGGCPFIKGATGNIATEDTAHLLHQLGFETNIDIKKVSEVSQEIEARLGNQNMPSFMYKLINRKDIQII